MGNAALVANDVGMLKFKVPTRLLSADAVTGPFDVIAVVETSDLDTLIESLTDRIQMIRGVERTTTCASSAPRSD